MVLVKSLYHSTLLACRVDHLNPFFLYMLKPVPDPDEGLSPVKRSELALAVGGVGAAVVTSLHTTTRRKERGLERFGMIGGHKNDELAVKSLVRRQHLDVAQTESLRESVVASALATVDVRVHRVEHHIVRQRFTDHTAHPVAGLDLADAALQHQRMVRNHEVAAVGPSLIDDLLRHLEADHRAGNLLPHIAALHAAVVEVLLQVEGEFLF